MKRAAQSAAPVLEWSPEHCAVFDSATGVSAHGPDIASVSGKISGGRVLVALSRRSAFVRTVRVPNAGDREIRQVLGVQGAQLFPSAEGSLASDFFVTDDVTAEGRAAVVVATSRGTLDRLDADLGSAGLRPEAVLPVALGSPLLARAHGMQHCAVVEQTPEGIAIDIVYGGALRASRVVPTPRDLADLDGEVCRTFAVAGLPCGPILAAGGLQVPGAPYSAKATAREALASPDGRAIGLHLELPEVTARREGSRSSARARLAILLCAAAIVLGTMVAMDRADLAAAARKEDAKWDSQARGLRSSRDAARAKAASAMRIVGPLRVAFEPAQPASDVLLLTGNLAPEGVWITGTTFERGKPIQIRGTATKNEAVTAYVDALSAQDRFRDVRLAFASNALIEETPVVNFSITAHVVGNLPVVEAKAGRPK